eukprot:COSAG01_NODE_3646_length_5830_cov_7.276217_3_plen_133_part_00
MLVESGHQHYIRLVIQAMPRGLAVNTSPLLSGDDGGTLLDDSDIDAELMRAVRELRCHQNAPAQAMLDQIEAMAPLAMKTALRGLVEGLDEAQRDELVATSSSEDEDGDEVYGLEGTAQCTALQLIRTLLAH